MKFYQLVKRIIDVVGSGVLILLLLPVFTLVSGAIWLLEGRPIFYHSRRLVASNREVDIVKFRTMVLDATSSKYQLEEKFMRDGYLDIPLSCEVYTPIGRLLERTQVVELLQLFNVFIGQMSFIGNRPLPHRNLSHLAKTGAWKARFDCPAGITGISQVIGKHDLLPAERLEMETLYAKVYQSGRVLKCDLVILFYTISLVFAGKPLSLHRARLLLNNCLNCE
jgi:lipopolysaccharide/colanic/teichoic acid biosynthesis glycosyltransferase